VTTPYGSEALSAYLKATSLVREGRYEEARSVEMLPSDAKLIERKIEEHMAAGANGRHEWLDN